MDHKIVYSKTGKGVLEIKNKAGKLSRELAKVLGLVDGKSSVEDLIAKSKLSEVDVGRVLRQLEDRGYIKEFSNLSGAMSSASSSGSSSYVDDLDFTSQLSPGKRVYSSSQAEMRARESSDREQAEAEARRKREQAEQQKKNQATQQAREEATRMARIETERKAKEAAALKTKQQSEMKAQQQAAEMEKTTRDLAKILEAERQALEKSDRQKKEVQARKAKEEAAVRAKEEAARKAKEEVERKRREEEERKRREQEERKRRKEEEERKRREQEERKRREEEERKRRKEEEERKRREQEERKRREEEERKRREQEERKRREEEERKRREEEERKRREEEERKQREEEERKQREEEERKQREEEERKRREQEERRQREEEERKRREEEDRRREEEDRRREEEDRRREEEERQRREEEDEGERKQRDDEEDRRRQEEDQRREEEDRRREEEEEEDRLRKEEEEERRRREEEEEEDRLRKEEEEEETEAPGFNIGNFDLPPASGSGESSSPSFDVPSTSSDSESDSDSRIDLSSFDTESSESFTADFDRQQELLRKQEAEEKRRREEAEQAQITMERAHREEEAREEAARRAAMEAEMRARVEMEKVDRAERERAKEEEYKRKIEQEEERKRAETQKKEREEIERAEADRNKREEDLVRRRQQAEEADRKRAEIKALQKRGRIRSPLERARPVVLGVLGIFALLVGAIQFMPMSGYIPTLEKMISNHVGEPVTIGSMKMSVVSGFQFELGNVNIGTTQDVTLIDVLVTPELGSLFGDKLVLNSIEADGGSIVKEALVRFPDWLRTSVSDQRIDVRKISLRGVKLEMRTFEMPSLNASLVFGRNGTIKSAMVETADRRLSVDIATLDGRAEVAIRGNNWTAPIGAPVELTDFTGSGTLRGSTLTLSEWEATVYGGQVNGTAELSWAPRWRLSSQFEFVRIETEEMLAAFSDTAKVTGSASGKGSFLSEAGSVDALLDRPSLQGSFAVKKGAVDGVDLVRALQAGRTGTQGGSTRFEELTGEVKIANGRYGYRNVRLAAGILSARSNFDISNNQEVSGRVSVALRSPAQQLSANLNLSGTLRGPSLRP